MSTVPFTGVTVGGAITMAWNGTDLARHRDGRKGRSTASKARTVARLPCLSGRHSGILHPRVWTQVSSFCLPLGNALGMELSLLQAHPQHWQGPWCTRAENVVPQLTVSPWKIAVATTPKAGARSKGEWLACTMK